MFQPQEMFNKQTGNYSALEYLTAKFKLTLPEETVF